MGDRGCAPGRSGFYYEFQLSKFESRCLKKKSVHIAQNLACVSSLLSDCLAVQTLISFDNLSQRENTMLMRQESKSYGNLPENLKEQNKKTHSNPQMAS